MRASTYSSERAKHDGSKAEDATCKCSPGVLRCLLCVNIKAGLCTQTPETTHDEERHDPCVSLIYVYRIVADKTRYETAYANDNDSDDEGNTMGSIDRSKGLAAEDNRSGSEAESR